MPSTFRVARGLHAPMGLSDYGPLALLHKAERMISLISRATAWWNSE